MITFPLLIINILCLIYNLTEYIENGSQINLTIGTINSFACLMLVWRIYEE